MQRAVYGRYMYGGDLFMEDVGVFDGGHSLLDILLMCVACVTTNYSFSILHPHQDGGPRPAHYHAVSLVLLS